LDDKMMDTENAVPLKSENDTPSSFKSKDTPDSENKPLSTESATVSTENKSMDVENGTGKEEAGNEENKNVNVTESVKRLHYSDGSKLPARQGEGELIYDNGNLYLEKPEVGLESFRVVWNHDTNPKDDQLMDLVNLKVVFSRQLPKMPKEYITRLIMDRHHRSLCLKKYTISNRWDVSGGICIRPFVEQKFAEIVFCAVAAHEQVRGYGTKLMNELKAYAQLLGLTHFLAYADNYAIGYFRKQGFTKNISMPPERYKGFIKEYVGSTLMECYVHPKADYVHLNDMLAKQRRAIQQKCEKVSNSHRVYDGLSIYVNPKPDRKTVLIEEIPGVAESGYNPSQRKRSTRFRTDLPGSIMRMNAKFRSILKLIRNLKDSWPFQEPVDGSLVQDYYKFIKHPMDLKTMREKLEDLHYRNKKSFIHDFKLIVNNCKQYNEEGSVYVRCAEAIDAKFDELIDTIDSSTV